MDVDEAKVVIKKIIEDVLDKKIIFGDEEQLIGGTIDSMNLVEVCLSLEDIADGHGFEFDWTSESTMSKSKSMFRNINSLANEFSKQSKG